MLCLNYTAAPVSGSLLPASVGESYVSENEQDTTKFNLMMNRMAMYLQCSASTIECWGTVANSGDADALSIFPRVYRLGNPLDI